MEVLLKSITKDNFRELYGDYGMAILKEISEKDITQKINSFETHLLRVILLQLLGDNTI